MISGTLLSAPRGPACSRISIAAATSIASRSCAPTLAASGSTPANGSSTTRRISISSPATQLALEECHFLIIISYYAATLCRSDAPSSGGLLSTSHQGKKSTADGTNRLSSWAAMGVM